MVKEEKKSKVGILAAKPVYLQNIPCNAMFFSDMFKGWGRGEERYIGIFESKRRDDLWARDMEQEVTILGLFNFTNKSKHKTVLQLPRQ